MYRCGYCGLVSQGNYCSNLRCRNFCNRYDGGTRGGETDCGEGVCGLNAASDAKGEAYRPAPLPAQPAQPAQPSPARRPPAEPYAPAPPPRNTENDGGRDGRFNNGGAEDGRFQSENMIDGRLGEGASGGRSPGAGEQTPYAGGTLSFAAVPFQKYGGIYPLNEGARAGTVFPELDMPYRKKIIKRG